MLIRFIDRRVPVLNHTHASYCWLCTSNIPLHPFPPYIYIHIQIIHSQILVGDETTHESPFHASAFTGLFFERLLCWLLHLQFRATWACENQKSIRSLRKSMEDGEDVWVCHWVFWKDLKREYNGSKFKAPTTVSVAVPNMIGGMHLLCNIGIDHWLTCGSEPRSFVSCSLTICEAEILSNTSAVQSHEMYPL